MQYFGESKFVDPKLLAITQEKLASETTDKKVLRIGIPKEITRYEKRVPLTPESVAAIVARGAEVFVEHNAGLFSNYTDQQYSEAGAQICISAPELYEKSDIIIKVARPTEEEIDWMKPKTILVSALNIGTLTADFCKHLASRNISSVAYEFLESRDGSIPIMQMMSEIAGITSIHIAAELLSAQKGGQGLLLGGITGVPPATVTILGAGNVGFQAASAAIALGANVKVIDEEISKLRKLEEKLGMKIWTSVSLPNYIHEAVISSDVVIGAVFKPGRRTPLLVLQENIAKMREGSVIIDISIDQGGCFETSRITTHEQPTFVDSGVIHYCVPNIASRVPRTGSAALSNILGPVLARLVDYGGNVGADMMFKKGIYVHHKHITNKGISRMFGFDYIDINLLHTANT